VRETVEVFRALDTPDRADVVTGVATAVIAALRGGGRALWFGNGGSAADAAHLAAEFLGRFKHDRTPLAAVALVDNPAAVTAIANDYGYAEVFARQVGGLGRPGDVALGMSTSGRSPNVLRGLEAARDGGLVTVAFCGQDDAAMRERADFVLSVPCGETATIQEAHKLMGHVVCELVERAFLVPGE